MFLPVVQNMLVGLVRNRQRIEFLAQLADELQLGAIEYLAGGIVRRVDDDGLRLLTERPPKLIIVEDELVTSLSYS